MKAVFLNYATPTRTVWQFYDFLTHREIWKLNCETVSWVKLKALEGLPLTLLCKVSSQLTLEKNGSLMTSLASSGLPPRLWRLWYVYFHWNKSLTRVDILLLLSFLVFSTLYYDSLVWSNTGKCNIKKL